MLGTLALATQPSVIALQVLGISYRLYALGYVVVAVLWKRIDWCVPEPARSAA